LCFAGHHDWEYLLHKSEEAAWAEHQSNGGVTVTGAGGPYIHKRCCLRCGLKQDTSTPFIQERQRRVEESKRRHNLAKQIYNG